MKNFSSLRSTAKNQASKGKVLTADKKQNQTPRDKARKNQQKQPLSYPAIEIMTGTLQLVMLRLVVTNLDNIC